MFNNFRMLFNKCYTLSSIRWQRVLEDSRIMISILQKILLMIQDKLNKETCIATYLFTKNVMKLARKSGFLFTALYLKQCGSCLQTAYGGVHTPPSQLPVFVALNRKGFPTIIPSFHRRKIIKRDDEADRLVQLYLSFFTINKIIKLAKKVSYENTLKSIVEPTDLEAASVWCGEFRTHLRKLIVRYLPFVSTIPLNQGMSWTPTWKSLPTHRRVREVFREVIQENKLPRRLVSCFPSLLFELNDFSFLMERVHVSEDHFSQGVLWPSYTRYAMDPRNTSITNYLLDKFEATAGPQLPSYHQIKEAPICGRLGQSIEGGGKRRIFAIGNYINQRLLHPVHNWLMSVLSCLPTDGTFNQDKPLDNLVGEQHCFSFDLKSATDRWPLQIMFEVMSMLFDRSFASSVRSCLALNLFEVPFWKGKQKQTVSFVAGQPLGYYSSWPLFSLSHHMLIWWCAEQIYPGDRFIRYGVLGDDVVICDSRVASLYSSTLTRLNIQISLQKSLISDTGCAEFAKRLRIHNLAKDVSPLSVRAFLNFYHPFGLISLGLKYHNKRFSTLARIGGAGYKQLAKIDRQKNARFSRLWSMHLKALLSKGSLELWLGRGQPLNPYIRGIIINKMRNKMIPKDIKVCPANLFPTDGVNSICEYTLQMGWMRQWLTYCRWFFVIVLDPWVKLSDLFDGPMNTTSWYAEPVKDENLIKFGALWAMYDLVGQMLSDPKLSILALDATEQQCSGWLLGGVKGSDFLVRAIGLVQPRARSGIVLPGVVLHESYCRGDDPRYTLIRYKTLGVSDRQSILDFIR